MHEPIQADARPFIENSSHGGRRLRVAVVTETYPPEVNGVAMTVGRLVGGLAARQHQVQLIRPCQGAGDGSPGVDGVAEVLVPGLPIPRYAGLRFGLPALRTLRRLWWDEPPDIVHLVTEGPLGLAARLVAHSLDLPVSSGFHTNFHSYSHHYGVGWLRRGISGYLRHFHNATDVTFVPTATLAESLAADGYRNVQVLSRGVDTHLFRPERRDEALRRRWGVAPDDLVVIHVGRLAPEKNLDTVLAAFQAIRRLRSDARLVLVGNGPLEAALRARHPDLIHAGVRAGEDLATHYASADLFLFPSVTETFGNVVTEALASGLAVLAYDCAAAGEIIHTGHDGVLVETGNTAAFKQAATRLAADPHRLRWLRRHAPGAVGHLDWDLIHHQFARALSTITRQHQRNVSAREGLLIITE